MTVSAAPAALERLRVLEQAARQQVARRRVEAGMRARLLLDRHLQIKYRHEEKLPLFIFVEEAHRFAAPPDEGGSRFSRDILARIAAEGAKFGVFLTVISQRPRRIDPDILSNCSNLAILRVVNSTDQNTIQAASESFSEDLLADLPALEQGEAVLVGPFVPVPVMIKTEIRETRHGGRTPEIADLLRQAREDVEIIRRGTGSHSTRCPACASPSSPTSTSGRSIPLAIAEHRREAFEKALTKAVDAIVTAGVDYVFICGDLFERRTLRPHMVEFTQRELFRLVKQTEAKHKRSIRILVIRGNHDGRSQSEALDYIRHPLAGYLHVFGDDAIIYNDDRLHVVGRESMPRWTFVLAFALVSYGHGAAFIESFVNYPSWNLIGSDAFLSYHKFIGPRVIAFLVLPAVLGTVFTIVLLRFRPAAIPLWSVWVAILLQLVVWVSTATIQIPIQLQLAVQGASPALLERRMETNWWLRRIP